MTKNEFLTKIQTSFTKILPGIKAHQSMAPLGRIIDPEQLNNTDSYRHSAVGIHCYPINNQLHFLLIQRPDYDGAHSGQIAFPGGKKEEEDSTLEVCARRESQEEVGIDSNEGILLGQLTEVYIPVSRFIVVPFVFFHEEQPQLTLDQREVSSVLEPSISQLLSDHIIASTDMTVGNGMKLRNVPYYLLNDRIVWGATALILSEFRELLKTES